MGPRLLGSIAARPIILSPESQEDHPGIRSNHGYPGIRQWKARLIPSILITNRVDLRPGTPFAFLFANYQIA